jgi:integrase
LGPSGGETAASRRFIAEGDARLQRNPCLRRKRYACRHRDRVFDMHNFRARDWRPAQLAGGIEPLRRPYDLRHTYATFALRAGVSIFDLSRFMGASLAMIDKHYGHLARDGREHAVRLFDAHARDSAAWTPGGRRNSHRKPARRKRSRPH